MMKIICPLRSFVGLFLLLFMIVTAGCATIVSKSKYPVTICSSPEGATVVIKNKKGEKINTVTTPATITLPAHAGYFSSALYTFEFQKGGTLSQTEALSAHLDPWYFGNLLLGGLVGLIFIDPITGAMWKLDDHVQCSFSSGSTLPPGNSINGAQPSEQPPSKEQADQLNTLKESGMLMGVP